jgi:hypothetical protein
VKFNELKVGSKIRIVSLPGIGILNYCMHWETVEAYEKLIARKRAVRISEITVDGLPWFEFKLKHAGKMEHHRMCVAPDDMNWVPVKSRK